MHQLVGCEDIDKATPVRVCAHQVGERQRRFSEEISRALVFQHQQAPLDRADRRRRHIAVAQRQG